MEMLHNGGTINELPLKYNNYSIHDFIITIMGIVDDDYW